MYNISKGQLRVVVIGGAIFWLVSLIEADSYSADWWGIFGAVVTPFLIAFYIIGWRNRHKEQNINEHSLKIKFLSIFSKKKIIGFILFIILIPIALFYLLDYSNQREQEMQNTIEREEYVGKLKRYTTHLTNAQNCVSEAINRELPDKKSACDIKYETAYSNYKDCKALFYDDSYCNSLYQNNYKQYDCSTTTLSKEIEERSRSVCYITVGSEYRDIIRYEEELTDEYLKSLPLDKSYLTTQDLKDLEAKFPADVFDEKTLDRIKERVTKQGYSIEPS